MEVGRFMKPFSLEGSTEGPDGGESGSGLGGGLTGDKVLGVNAIDINPAHQLMCFGTETVQGRGTVEMWDPRSRTRAGLLRLPYTSLMGSSQSSASLLQPKLPGVDDYLGSMGLSVTSLSNKSDGLNLAVGTSTGHVLLYDLRANRPYQTKDQGYGLPVKKVEWIESGRQGAGDSEAEGGWVASADEKVVKIWGKETVSLLAFPRRFDPLFYSLSRITVTGYESRRHQSTYANQRSTCLPWNRISLPRQRNFSHDGLLRPSIGSRTEMVSILGQHDGRDGRRSRYSTL